MLLKKILFIYLITFCSISYSQSKYFHHITNLNGISQSEVYSFLEDSRGFMWFGTVDGLNRYDGYEIKVFNTDKSNPNSISNNTIRSLAEDRFGRIWIGTDDGLCVYNLSSEKIVQLKVKNIGKNSLLKIQSIIVFNDYILIATANGILKADIKTLDLKKIEQELKWVPFIKNYNIDVFNLHSNKDGSVWIATSGVLYRIFFENKSNNPKILEKIADRRFADNINIVLEEDKFGNLWIVTHQNGFFKYNPSSKRIDDFNVKKTIIGSKMYSSVVIDNTNNLWISSRDKGLLFLSREHLNDLDPKFESITTSSYDVKSLSSNLIYSLYVSRGNILWIGTIGSGINIYDPQQKGFNRIKIPLYNQQTLSTSSFIRSIFNYNKNNIWLGTHNNGLYILNRENKTFKKAGFGNHSVFYIYSIDNDKTIVCSANGFAIATLVNNDLKISNIKTTFPYFYATKSREDIVWLAGLEGLTKCKITNGKITIEKEYSIKTKPSISLNNCRVLFYHEEKNQLLVGTEGGGLNILKLDSQHNVTSVRIFKKNSSKRSISSNYIRSITQDSYGNFWIGTYEGLNKINLDGNNSNIVFKSFTKEEGLPNNMIQSLVEDNQKQLWIGTNGGLSRFDLKNEKFVNFSESDGLQSNEFSEHAVFKKLDGEIIIGGTNGINTFYPQKIISNNIAPKTTITNFYLFNKKVEISDQKGNETPLKKSISLTDTLYLEPDQTSFGFDFSAMLHSNPNKVKYAYKLDGFDENWNYTDSKNRRANYTNIKHGSYIFLVKSSSVDGKLEENPRRIYIKIRTPFMYTWVAFLIYFLIIVFLITYFTKYSVIKYTTKKRIILDSEHNRKLHELDELRTRFFINISHDIRTPLTLISSPLEIVLKNDNIVPEVKEHLNLIQRNIKKLKYITEQLLDFSKVEVGKLSVKRTNNEIVSFIKQEAKHFAFALQSKNLMCEIKSAKNEIFTEFDTDMLSKVFFNLLSNAIKNTNQGKINILIEEVSNENQQVLKNSTYTKFIRIDIEDTGEGIAQEELDKIFDRYYQGKSNTSYGYGIGLSHCKDLVDAFGGVIEATSEKGIGTKFRIYVPNINADVPIKSELVSSIDGEVIALEEIELDDKNDLQLKNNNFTKILVIDDNIEMLNFIFKELSKEFNVIKANDGLEGLEIATKFMPDLIISDIMMPNINGIEFCEKIKSDIKTSHIPIILLTARADESSKYEGIEMGADDYIFKPFSIEFLVLRIKNILKNREQLQKLFQLQYSLKPTDIVVPSLDEKFLNQLMSAIEERLSDPEFTINSLESIMGMSHANFYRKIKNLTGQSGKDILLNVRMKRAKQILTDNKGLRISEVAYMVGYNNPKYFSQSFKEFFGVLPSDI